MEALYAGILREAVKDLARPRHSQLRFFPQHKINFVARSPEREEEVICAEHWFTEQVYKGAESTFRVCLDVVGIPHSSAVRFTEMVMALKEEFYATGCPVILHQLISIHRRASEVVDEA